MHLRTNLLTAKHGSSTTWMLEDIGMPLGDLVDAATSRHWDKVVPGSDYEYDLDLLVQAATDGDVMSFRALQLEIENLNQDVERVYQALRCIVEDNDRRKVLDKIDRL